MALSSEFELTHVRSEGDGGKSDEHWIKRFGSDGGNAILSADGNILKQPNEIVAICDAGVIGIFLHHKWAASPGHIQASHILYWWRDIETLVKEQAARTCWRIPFQFPDKPKFKKLSPEYDKQRKKLRKQARREKIT